MNNNIEHEHDEAFDVDEFFGEKKARWFQIAARNGVREALAQGIYRILVVLPTGAGKTITSGLIFTDPQIQQILNIPKKRKMKLLFIAHTNRLLTQAERTFAEMNNVDLRLLSAFAGSDLDKALEEGVDLVCIDEAHHEAMMSIQYKLDKIGHLPIIGLTATEDRPDGLLLKFQKVIAPISRQQAVDEGYLAETSINSVIDYSGTDKVDVLSDLLRNYGNQMGQTFIYVKTKAEMRHLVDLIRDELGKVVVGLDKQTPRQVDLVLDEFSARNVQFIVNCNKLNEGIDVKGCTDVLLGRQVGSYVQLNQVIGRAARPDSTCTVWELINPLSKTNLDSSVIVGTPLSHRVLSKRSGKWIEQFMQYEEFV